MRTRTVAVVALVLAACLPVAGWAQQPAKVQITGVRVGFPSTGQGFGFKAGAWAPVFIDLAATAPVSRLDGSITLGARDNADLQAVYREELPALSKDEQRIMVAYMRLPGAVTMSTPRLALHDSSGRTVEAWELWDDPSRYPKPAPNQKPLPAFSKYTVLSPDRFVYLTMGVRNTGLQAGLRGRVDPNAGTEQESDDQTRDGREFFYVNGVPQLPDRWFGYGSVDVALLHTGANQTFISELLQDRSHRKEALAEWVRRGGRLVVSVGGNYQFAGKLIQEMKLIDVEVTGLTSRSQMFGVRAWAEEQKPFDGGPAKDKAGEGNRPVSFAKLEKLGPGVDVLAVEKEEGADAEIRPVIVQAACGLGRVILVAFDLDKDPFTRWPGSPGFWKKLQRLVEAPQASPRGDPAQTGGWNAGPQNELAGRFYTRLDTFDEVPVVSFGWVALFILIYIVVVGPLDYLFLTKVIKRPELTWVTFPLVVIVISAVAYATAYWLKGNDLRINKLDVVDIVAEMDEAGDSRGTAVYGSTWFTLFSPRIQNYTIGVQPPETWVPPRTKPGQDYSTVVTWFARPDDTAGGGGGALSLSRRDYTYAADAAGLESVPIQVWTTKSFQASWQAALTEAKPLITAELGHPPGDEKKLIGRLKSDLPVTLKDTVLIYRDTVYGLGDLPPGATTLDLERAGLSKQSAVKWYEDAARLPAVANYGSGFGTPPAATAYSTAPGNPRVPAGWSSLVKCLMFHDRFENSVRNSLMKTLDEGWQLDRRETAVVVGRAASVGADQSTAEAVTADPVSPSQLWLGELPSAGGKRPALNGKMTQETYVRLFLPVKPAGK